MYLNMNWLIEILNTKTYDYDIFESLLIYTQS